MGGEVVVLYQLGGQMVCGSNKGRLGRISVSLFEDLELRNTLKIVKVPPGTEFQIEVQLPGGEVQAVAAESIPPPSVHIEEYKIPLDQKIVVGPILIAAGYSHYSRTWYGWLAGKGNYGEHKTINTDPDAMGK
jgi:hypothetical protein